MTLLNFMTAIYWGQLSHCEKLSYVVSHYSCSSRSAYGAVCAFAVLLFLLQLAFTAGLVVFRGELITESAGGYDEISGSGGSHNPYDGPSATSSYPGTAPSADL